MCDLRQFIIDEIEEINRHKWIESEKAHRDLGQQAIQEWIDKYSRMFRRYWIANHRCEA